ARVLDVEGRVATVEVDQLYDAVRVGDLAVPFPDFQPVMGTVDRAERAIEGRIVAFAKTHPLQSVHDLVLVDLGEASGGGAGGPPHRVGEGDRAGAPRAPAGAPGEGDRPGAVRGAPRTGSPADRDALPQPGRASVRLFEEGSIP